MNKDFILIGDVSYFSQLDNLYDPFISCYPTSMAMTIDYCLKEINKTKKDIGCDYDIQLEDYIYNYSYSREVKNFLRKNSGHFGSWVWKYRPITIAYVQEFIFNKFMNKFGFKCEFKTNCSFDFLTNLLYNEHLPQILHGNFSKTKKIKGHICACIGYNFLTDLVFCHDPFGNANLLYEDKNGAFMEYNFYDYFIKNKKNNTTWITSISRT